MSETAPLTPKTKISDLKRRALLDAAMTEFESRGLDGASLRSIAATAGVTTGAIYSMFGGKSDLYAALLFESLDRLEAYVRAAAQAQSDPLAAVDASVMAFFEYYNARLFEAQLGLHSFSGFKRASLGKDLDDALNSALLRTLEIIAGTVRTAAPDLDADTVQSERDALFGDLIGALSLAHTGRARSIGTTPEAILKTKLTQLRGRLKPH